MSQENFIGYEYHSITTHREMESVYADGYRNFGWELETSDTQKNGIDTVSMKFRRDRKIRNKAELTRLQRQFNACAEEIVSMERSKTAAASISAFTTGLVGCAFMAGSVFAVTAATPHIILCAVLAVPGFLGWILPYFFYGVLRRKKTAAMNPLIEQKYDEIYDVCEKANALLGNER